MMTRKTMAVYAALMALIMAIPSQAQQVFTGDKKLACEAVLCLSVVSPPAECAPALTRYFSISLRHFKDTVKAHADFLNMCPRSDQPAQFQTQLSGQQANVYGGGAAVLPAPTRGDFPAK